MLRRSHRLLTFAAAAAILLPPLARADDRGDQGDSPRLVDRGDSPRLVERSDSPRLVERSDSPRLVDRGDSPRLVERSVDQDREWEEDYQGQWTDEPAPGDDYRVSVDLDNDSDAGVTLDTFQGALAPYGEWVVVAGHGRVWRPHVVAGWRPYYYGRWEWTNEGWLWVSEEPFGWAAYHYGRWTYDDYYGWLWVPGYQWAPAWVSWRYSGDVVGWAPLGPGVSVYVSSYPFVATWWTFAPCSGFVGAPIYRVAYAPSYTRRYFDQTAAAPPRAWARGGRSVPAPGPAWGGPPPRVIESRIGRRLDPVRVVTAPAPGPSRVGPGEVSIFRPGARGGRPIEGVRPAPAQRGLDRPGFATGLGRGGAASPSGRSQGDSSRPPPRVENRGSAPGAGGSAPGVDRPAQRTVPVPGRISPARPEERPQGGVAPRGWGGPQGGRPVREQGSGSGGGFTGGGRVPVPAAPAAPPRASAPAPARGGGDHVRADPPRHRD